MEGTSRAPPGTEPYPEPEEGAGDEGTGDMGAGESGAGDTGGGDMGAGVHVGVAGASLVATPEAGAGVCAIAPDSISRCT